MAVGMAGNNNNKGTNMTLGMKSITPELQNSIMEVLKGNQDKIDKNKNGKIDKEDFKLLKKEKDTQNDQVDESSYSAKAARHGEDIGKPGKNFAKIASKAGTKYGSKEAGARVAGAILKKLRSEEYTEDDLVIIETAIEEGWDDMLKAVKEKQKPQPNGGAGKKQGSAYGGSKQKETKEPVKEDVLSTEEADRIAQIAKDLGL
jgi:hypothetical protein